MVESTEQSFGQTSKKDDNGGVSPSQSFSEAHQNPSCVMNMNWCMHAQECMHRHARGAAMEYICVDASISVWAYVCSSVEKSMRKCLWVGRELCVGKMCICCRRARMCVHTLVGA